MQWWLSYEVVAMGLAGWISYLGIVSCCVGILAMAEFLTLECDNVTNAHLMVELTGKGGMVYYCRLCRRTYYLRTNKHGAPNNREYTKLFYRDIVQPSKPLYFKVHPEKMRLGDIL